MKSDLKALASEWQGFVYLGTSIKNVSNSLKQGTRAQHVENSSNATILPLSSRQSGDRVRIVSLNCGEFNNRLMGMGFMPDVVLEVISCTPTGSVIVALQDQRLGLGADMAQRIQVIDAEQQLGESPNTSRTRITTMQTTPDVSTVKLRDMAIGTTLRVVGYEPTARDYKRKLLAMGLTPGTELRITRYAPLGDPTEISVRGFQLSLRKAEADALIVVLVSRS